MEISITQHQATLLAAAVEYVLGNEVFRNDEMALVNAHAALGFAPGFDRITALAFASVGNVALGMDREGFGRL